MNIELINTGTELLLGDTINTNAAWIGQRLAALGLQVGRQTIVPDGAIIKEVEHGVALGGFVVLALPPVGAHRAVAEVAHSIEKNDSPCVKFLCGLSHGVFC